jgi:hypothetical protein
MSKTIKYFKLGALSPGNFITILSICISFSCTKEIEFDPSYQPDVYVLNSLISPKEDIKFFLNKTSSMSDTARNSVDYLSVHLLEDGINVTTTIERTNYFFNINYKPTEGKKYRFEIFMMGQNAPLVAEDSVPSSVHLIDATYTYPAYKDQYDLGWGDLKISFDDEKNTSNFYEVILLH